MNTDTATLTALVAAYRHHDALVADSGLHARYPDAGDDAVDIGGTYGDGPDAIARAIALSSDSGAPLDLLVAQVKAVAAWNRIVAVGESIGLPYSVAADWTDTLVAVK